MTEYEFWDNTDDPASGHFYLNGVMVAPHTLVDVPASQLGQVTFVTGTDSNLLQVRAFDGVSWSAAWSAWWSPFNVNIAQTVAAGGSLELSSAFSGTIGFAGPTGTLVIDQSSTFAGTIAGQLATGDVIDLLDIKAGANATIGYSGNNSPGILSVSDGTHTANIALLGNYMASSFVASSDGHGGTSVVDPPGGSASQVPLLTNPHA